MSDGRTDDGRTADTIDAIRGDELAALLEDVHRIADGVGSIRELAVTLAAPAARTTTGGEPLRVRYRIEELRRLHDEALSDGRTVVSVPGPLLSMVLQLIDQHVRRG